VLDTRQDLAACVAWKEVALAFHSLPQNWWRRDDTWCTWCHREGLVGIKSKTDESMRQAASDPAILTLSFSLYYTLEVFYSFSLWLGQINRIIEERGTLPLILFSFAFPSLENMSRELYFNFSFNN
jgi:hypothetical protein